MLAICPALKIQLATESLLLQQYSLTAHSRSTQSNQSNFARYESIALTSSATYRTDVFTGMVCCMGVFSAVTSRS